MGYRDEGVSVAGARYSEEVISLLRSLVAATLVVQQEFPQLHLISHHVKNQDIISIATIENPAWVADDLPINRVREFWRLSS